MSGRATAWLAAVVLLAFVAAGCGSAAGRPKLGKVSGKVTHKGQPVTSGEVTFTPATGKGGESGNVAFGKIGADGSYDLTTFDTGDGAVLGQHIVTVRVFDPALRVWQAAEMGARPPRDRVRSGGRG